MQNLIKTLTLLLVFIISFTIQAQPPIEWEAYFGGGEIDSPYGVVEDTDGGFVIVGSAISENGDVSESYGNGDLWIIKLDETGSLVWEKNFGGSGRDAGLTISKTSDGGFIVGGTTNSTDGDVAGYDGGFRDAWLLKIDQDGNFMWEKTFGSPSALTNSYEQIASVQETKNDGYLALITAYGEGGDVGEYFGGGDYWLIRTDELGNILWERSYGGSGTEVARNLIITSDNEILLAGTSSSIDGDLLGASGADGFWVLKLDSEGNIIWNKFYEGGFLPSIASTSDSGYILFGRAKENGQQGGQRDYRVVKIDGEGNPLWEKNYGGSAWDSFTTSVRETNQGNFILCGASMSNDIDVSDNNGLYDNWILEVDSIGNIVWEKCYGGMGSDYPGELILTSDGGMLLTSNSGSNEGTVGGVNGGSNDFWIVKFSGTPSAITSIEQESLLQVYPNPSNGNFTLSLENQSAEKLVEIVDVQGKVIYSEKTIGSQLNVNNIRAGNYVIRVVQKDLIKYKQIIVSESR